MQTTFPKMARSWKSRNCFKSRARKSWSRNTCNIPPETKKNKFSAICKSKTTSIKNLDLFIKNLEKDMINPIDVIKFRHNITREEQIALNDMSNWNEQTIRIQDKGLRYVILDNSEKIRPKSTTSNKNKFIWKNFRKP